MSEIKVRWEIFISHTVSPIRGIVRVDEEETDDVITEIVHEAVDDAITSRITWEKETVTK